MVRQSFVEQALGFRITENRIEYLNIRAAGRLVPPDVTTVYGTGEVRATRPATSQEVALWNLLILPDSEWSARDTDPESEAPGA